MTKRRKPITDLARRFPGRALAIQHSIRFRRVSTLYPHLVTRAYDRDIGRAARETDAQVAARVAAWERAHGFESRDWPAIGRDERAEA